MRTSIEPGMEYRFRNRVYTIVSVSDSEMIVVDRYDEEELHISKDEFDRHWINDEIKLVTGRMAKSIKNKLRLPVSTLTDDQKKVALRREDYIKRFLDKKYALKNSGTDLDYAKIIVEIAAELKDPYPPGLRTLMRWKSDYNIANGSIRSLINGLSNSDRKSTLDKYQNELIEKAIDNVYLQPEKGTVSQTHGELDDLVEIYNRENKDSDSAILKCPSRFQVQSAINSLDYLTVLEKRESKREATRVIRTSKHNYRPERILEIGETDHTILDYYVIDDDLLMPLGRPWMTNIMELFCRIPLGSEITYENGSFITISNALKMSMLPKTNFYKMYPDIKNTTNYSGILELLRTDNGADFTSKDLDDAALEIGMILHHVQVTKSWQKGTIEGFFRKQNVMLLDRMKGKTFSNILERAKYNPEKESLIRLSDFKRIIYKWLYDVYPYNKVRIEHGIEIIPHKLWEKNIKDHPQGFIEKSNLDIIMGKSAIRKAKDRGIEINNLKYDGVDLTRFRASHGNNETIKVKFDPSNLGYIHFFDKFEKRFVRLNAVDNEYANNLTLYQHNMIKRYVKEDMRRSEEDIRILMDGKIQLREMINDLLENKPSVLASKKGAKLRQGMSSSIADIDCDKNNSVSGDSIESAVTINNNNNLGSINRAENITEEIKNNTDCVKWTDDDIKW